MRMGRARLTPRARRAIGARPRRRAVVAGALGSLGASADERVSELVLALQSYVATLGTMELHYAGLASKPANEQTDLSAFRKAIDAFAGPAGVAKTLLMRARADFVRRGLTRTTNPPAGVSVDAWELSMTLDEASARPLLADLESARVRALDAGDAAMVEVSKRQVANGTRQAPLARSWTPTIDWSAGIGSARNALGRSLQRLKTGLNEMRESGVFSLVAIVGIGLLAIVLLGRAQR